MDPKPGYKPPTTAHEILDRYAQGERVFTDTKIENIDLSNQQLPGVIFSNSYLPDANFTNANLTRAQFSRAQILNARFSGANLTDAQFGEARLHGARFIGAMLFRANLTGALLPFADFQGANVSEAYLTNSTLRYTHGLEFDQNEIRGIAAPTPGASFVAALESASPPTKTIAQRASVIWDYYTLRGYPKWLALQNSYTGPWLVVYLFLTTVALLPHLISLGFWQGIAGVEQIPGATARLKVLLGATREERWQVWELLLNLHSGPWTSTLLTVVLLVFVILRATVTVRVSGLGHSQALSGWTPARQQYWPLVRLHGVISVLWIVAISSIAWHLWHWLTTPLTIFK